MKSTRLYKAYKTVTLLSFMLCERANLEVPPMETTMGADAAQPAPAPAEQVATGPDTSENIEKTGLQGNWVKKREWLLKAHEVFADIQGLGAEIELIRKKFLTGLNDTDALLDGYYKSLGVDQGKTQELFEDILKYLEKKRKQDISQKSAPTSDMKQDPEMAAKIDVIENYIKKSKDSLEQLKLDMESISDLGRSIVDRIKRVDERIVVVQDLLNKAQEIINDMWNIVDHNIAREKYYELSLTIFEKIKNEKSYLEQDLTADFESVIQTIQAQIDKTKENIKTLEDEGLFIQNRASRIKELKLKDLEKKEPSENDTQKDAKTALAEKKPATIKPRSFGEKVYDWAVWLVATATDTVTRFYNRVMALAFSKTSTPQKAQQQTAVPEKPKDIPQMPS